jgi:beta-ribofuranosylaminobenzene 5'-phosphate synthase
MDGELATDLPAPTRRLPHGRVRVHAPGRLHLGFLDPAGSLGRPWGSLGLAIAGPETIVELDRGDADSLSACPGGDAAQHFQVAARAPRVAGRP